MPGPVLVPGKSVLFNGETLAVYKGEYDNGRVAIELRLPGGEPYGKVTVNIPEIDLPPGYTFLKTYSGLEGMDAALYEAGVVRPTGGFAHGGFVKFPIAEVLV